MGLSILHVVLVLIHAEPDVLWSAVTSGGVYCSTEMGDLNGDGVPDAACGVYYFDNEPTVWAVSGADGSTIWTSSSYNGIYQNEGFRGIPDITGDGKKELLIATPGGYAPPGRCLYLVSGSDGSTIWEWAACQVMPSYTGWGYACCSVDDMTGDGVPECIGGFGTSGSSGTGLAACINGSTGDSLWTVWQPDAVETLCSYQDVNNDSYADILVGIGGNHYTANTARLLSGADGSILWEKNPGGDCMSIGLVEKADTWPFPVFCTFDGTAVCYDGGGMQQWDYSGSGMYLDVQGGPDVNGDGTGDIALAADNGGVVCLSGEDGTVLWTYPSGTNTWSVDWATDVILQGTPVHCVAAGSVNGRVVTLVNAVTGLQVWEMPFTERVYDVSVMDLGYPSPVVIAGLQDQESLPYHAWALATSLETGIESAVSNGLISVVNPVHGAVQFRVLSDTGVSVVCFNLSGRMVFQGNYASETSFSSPPLSAGMYLLKIDSGGEIETLRVTVL